ncbi:MAG: hypothetical protein M1502_03570 [Deltaproteobacteria bacterium]|nr:hypothetical protein [Deltaproteobacteria bacterium]
MIKKQIKILILSLVIFSANSVYAFSVLSPPYNQSDSNFNRLAMRAYNSGSPYIYTYGAYIYNAIPITTTMSGCKLIIIIRRTQGFPKPAYWAVENYKICSGNIAEIKNTNMAGWNNLPRGIKPVINNTIQQARQYGKASANYYGYMVIAKTGADDFILFTTLFYDFILADF